MIRQGKKEPMTGVTLCVALLGSIAVFLMLIPSAAIGACANESLRTGPSTKLPDCRAYELVTPQDANGRQFKDVQFGAVGDAFPTDMVSRSGASIAFSTRGSSLLEPEGGGGDAEYDVYEEERSASGWIGRYLSPLPDEALLQFSGGISSDHSYLFTHVGPFNKASGEYGSLYQGDAGYLGGPGGSFELIGVGSLGREKLVQGRYISQGGQHIIFSTGKLPSGSVWCEGAITKGRSCPVKQLEEDAAPTGTGSIYDRAAEGPTRVVSLLPNDVHAVAGEDAAYQGVSADGKVVAFKIKGNLYVRVDNSVTLEVTEAESEFGGLSEDGRYLFYLTEGNIHRFDTETKADIQVNSSGDGKMVNVSGDGSGVYFVSSQQLDGAKGILGQPNLYVWSEGVVTYIATVSPKDLEGTPGLTSWIKAVAPSKEGGPGLDSSRVTPDGSAIVFQSQARVTSYDNDEHTEIYRYEVGGGGVQCVSCNPSGSKATDEARFQNPAVIEPLMVVRNLSDNGTNVVFETSEALIENDTDGVNDIYEWHEAPEGGSQVSLITSGESHSYPLLEAALEPNSLFGVSGDGSDIFFTSQDELVHAAGVGGVPAIYDARVEGGFPEPPVPAVCSGEGCRPPMSSPPALGAAASGSLRGSGNLLPKIPKKKHRHCRRKGAKHKRCGKRKAKPSGDRLATASSATGSTSSAPAVGAKITQSSQVAGESPVAPEATVSGAQARGVIFEQFGIESVAAWPSTHVAGDHPDFTTDLALKSAGVVFAAKAKDVKITLPAGLIGNPTVIQRCSTGDFLGANCPIDSQVGVTRIVKSVPGKGTRTPVFNLQPPHPDREVARFGFTVGVLPVFIDISVRTDSDYGVTATVHDAPSVEPLLEAETTFWGDPAASSHDELRMSVEEANICETVCKNCETSCEPGGKRASGLSPVALMTNPSACQENVVGFSVTSYQLPGQVFSESASMGPTTECEGLPFAPTLEARPTSDVAGGPTGLHTTLTIHPHEKPEERGTATMREARVTLPEGMTVNPSAADGLAGCSDQQVGFHEEVDAECPDASKIGTAAISSPVLPHPLEGALYLRTPGGKGSQFRVWLVSDDLGLHVKIPGEVRPDPSSGQLTAVFSDIPQVPVKQVELEIWGGARAPLKNPDSCGSYETTSVISPWSNDPAATPSDHFEITRSSNGGPCPGSPSAEPNSPGFEAGTASPISATYSPLLVHLQRDDGSQPFGQLELTLPPGLVGKLAGLGECSDAAIAAATQSSGAAEQANPSCPASSQVGVVHAAAGAGPSPFWTEGKVYLAAPYQGAPLSVAIVAPAVAGPFDLGTIVVRSGLYLDPQTAQITVKEQMPQIVEGVPLDLRTVAVDVNREGFVLNGTSCEPLSFHGTSTSTLGNAAALSSPFQLAECARLPFKPKLSLVLKGPVTRTANPKLIADLKARPGDANIARAQVKLPNTVFLDNAHIGTVCTRVQFAADTCPKRSVYGKAWASTPLLGYRVAGPVYMRSSEHQLPDLVVKLKGPASQPIEFDLDGRLDSSHGGLRNTIEVVPDVPVERFHLELFGGKRGVLELTEGLCRNPKAAINFAAQNGRRLAGTPKVQAACGKHKKHGKNKR